METNPTTQEVDDFIARQEEVEALRDEATKLWWKQEWARNLKISWNRWNEIERASMEE